MYATRERQSGVSLLEASVALIVIGALWQVALHSHSLLDYMRAKRAVTELRGVETMVRVYRDRYGAVPGDDFDAPQRMAGAIGGSDDRPKNNGRIESLDGPVEGDTPITAAEVDESKLFWNHVRMAGLAPGNPSQGFASNAFNGRLFVTSGSARPTQPAGVRGLFSVCSSRIDANVARMVDSALDDGDATRGQVWAAREDLRGAFLPGTRQDVRFARAPTPYEAGNTYTVCKGF